MRMRAEVMNRRESRFEELKEQGHEEKEAIEMLAREEGIKKESMRIWLVYRGLVEEKISPVNREDAATPETKKAFLDILGGEPDQDGYYDRTVEEQMNDLGVEVIKKKEEPKEQLKVVATYAPWSRREVYYFNGIKVTKGYIYVFPKAVEMFGDEYMDMIQVCEYKGKRCIAFKVSEQERGLKIKRFQNGSAKIQSRNLTTWLNQHGIEEGVYKLKKVKNGFIAIKEEVN